MEEQRDTVSGQCPRGSDPRVKENSAQLLAKAQRAIDAAVTLLAGGDVEFAVGRARDFLREADRILGEADD